MAVIPERREVRIVEVPAPVARSERDVTVRMREVGICGTDREICAFHYGAPPAGSAQLVLGHEGLGEVVAVGPAVEQLRVGDLVVPMVRAPCDDPACVACRAGRQDFCVSGRFRERGIKEADGFMTDLVVEDERSLVPVPRALADVGVLVEPLTIAAKAATEVEVIRRRYPWRAAGRRGLVLGAGPVGLLAAMGLVAHDVETVVYSREPGTSDRARLVRSFGARYVSSEDMSIDALATASPAHRFNLIFEAAGSARVAFASLAALAPNGVCILSGVPHGEAPIEIDLDGIMRGIVLNNQVLLGTVNASRAAFEAAVRELERFMARFPDAVRSLITARVGLEEALESLRGSSGIKQVVSLAA